MAEAIKLTPMMKQYMEVKERCRDKILFFRLGDFLSLIHISEPTRPRLISYAVFCL